jgi:transposase
MEKHIAVGVDIAKAVFEVAISEEAGRVSKTRRLTRGTFLIFLAQVPKGTVVMEACGSAHYWAREIQGVGSRGRASPASSGETLRHREQDRPDRRERDLGGL